MGSIRFFEDQRFSDIHCAVIMDLVKHDVPVPGLEDVRIITRYYYPEPAGNFVNQPHLDTVANSTSIATA